MHILHLQNIMHCIYMFVLVTKFSLDVSKLLRELYKLSVQLFLTMESASTAMLMTHSQMIQKG